jgi:predicted SnoaL-like aldol condensation-catalyzing enzyme
VALHCRQDWPGNHVWVGMDIFRLDVQGKVVAHWDVLQIVPDNAAIPTACSETQPTGHVGTRINLSG